MALPKKKTPVTAPAASAAPAPVASPAPAPATAGPVTRSESKGSGTTAAKPTAARAASTPTYDQIAKRAYEIYAGRGYTDGNPQADWLEAERQLRAGL